MAIDLTTKRIAVTGGEGFLGRTVVARLQADGDGAAQPDPQTAPDAHHTAHDET